MNTVTIHQIDCYRIKDWDNEDELRLEIFTDKNRKVALTKEMQAGDSWTLNHTIQYEDFAMLKIWEDDEDVNKNTLLRKFSFDKKQKDEHKELTFGKEKARYIISYTVGNPSPKVALKGQEATQKTRIFRAKGSKASAPVETASTTGMKGNVKRPTTSPAPIEMNIPRGLFDPSKDGFSFPNSFNVRISLGFKFLPKIASKYGLCGGMSRVAGDCFLHRQEIPNFPKAPKIGSTLYKYLMKRQLDTFGKRFEYLGKFFQWWAFYSDKSLQQKTAAEFQKMQAEIKKHKTVLLGLMYVDYKKGGLWDNHQVLAIDYDIASDRTAYIRLYDPNFPKRKDVYLKVEMKRVPISGGRTSLRMICKQHIGSLMARHVRGFFIIPIDSEPVPEKIAKRITRSNATVG